MVLLPFCAQLYRIVMVGGARLQRTIKIPQSIHSNYKGFQELLSIAQDYGDSCSGDRVILDFKANTWFDANLLPVIYAVVYLGNEKGIAGAYSNQNTCRLHKLLIRNGFAKCCFKLPHEPLKYESAIPFKIFPPLPFVLLFIFVLLRFFILFSFLYYLMQILKNF